MTLKYVTVGKAGAYIIPTKCENHAGRIVAGNYYLRSSGVFGEYEPVAARMHVWDVLGAPLVNIDIHFYLDGSEAGTAKTDWLGNAYFTYPRIPKGGHVLKGEWKGDWLHDPCSSEISIKTVAMQEGYGKAYVESLTANPDQIMAKTEEELIKQEVGIVMTKVEADLERRRYVYTYLVPEEDTRSGESGLFIWWAIPLILAAVAAVLIAFAATVYVLVVYVLGTYVCGICGERFLTCEALREHLMSKHPSEWEKVKDRFECAPPASPWDWLKYILIGGLAVVGLVAIAKIAETLKR